MAIKIGSLLIRLAVEHGILQEGLAKSERDVAKTVKAIERQGREIADFGRRLSVAVTAPLLGLAAAASAAVNDMAGEVKAMKIAAGTAGASLEEFQRSANAALIGAGVETEKFSDILKDTQDKIGDFAATGGGELQDFFKKIAAPQGLTVNDFLGKSSVEQLRMYVAALEKAGVSSEEMVFYLESIADEGSALLPILKNNGKELDALGAKTAVIDEGAAEELKRYTDAQTELSGAFRELTIAAVNSGLPAALADLAKGAADILRQFSELSPTGFKLAVGLGAVAAVVGPIVTVFGSLVSGAAGLIATLGGFPTILSVVGAAFNTLLLSPLGLVVGAVAAVVAAWYYWDEIEAIVGDVGSAVSSWWTSTVAPVLGDVADALVKGVTVWFNFHVGALKYIALLVDGVRKWLVDKLGAVFDWVGKKVQAVTGFFFDMYDAVVGNSYVPDMVEGIGAEFAKLQALMVDPARKAAGDVTEATRKMAGDVLGLLDRLFPEMAKARQQAAELALLDSAPISEDLRSKARMRVLGGGRDNPTVSDWLTGNDPLVDVGAQLEGLQTQLGRTAEATKVQTVQIAESFRDMAQRSLQSIEGMVGAIKGGGFLDILGSAINMFLQLGSTGLFGKGLATKINAPRIPGNANGTAYHPGGLMTVGERGPEILQAPRGSRVVPNHELRAASQASGRLQVTVGVDPRNGNVTGFVDTRIGAAAPGIATGGAQLAQARLARRQSRRIG